MYDYIPGVGARWTDRDEDEVIYYLREAEGDLGVCSSHQAMVDLAMSGIPDGGNISQKTFAQMSRRSPVAREAKVRAIMRAIGLDHARVLARYYAPSLAANTARLSAISILTPEAHEGYEAALAEAMRATAAGTGRIVLRDEQRTRAIAACPEVASVEAWLAALRMRAAQGPDKRGAALVLSDLGLASRRLLRGAQVAYAMERKAYVEPWTPNARAVEFRAMLGVGS
jgi:hypothetical protein